MWNPWKGCHQFSAGCLNCYYYGQGKKEASVQKTPNFDLPLLKDSKGQYKIKSGTEVFVCFSSDFLIEDADSWRNEVWEMMKIRIDLNFLFLTKRIERLEKLLPHDWNEGYPNVAIGCTVENQEIADFRLPFFLRIPIKTRYIICSPLLEEIDLKAYLSDQIFGVTVGGEQGKLGRLCNYDWIIKIKEQCLANNVSFWFKQTGTVFQKDGIVYQVPFKKQHSQARSANINFSRKSK